MNLHLIQNTHSQIVSSVLDFMVEFWAKLTHFAFSFPEFYILTKFSDNVQSVGSDRSRQLFLMKEHFN